MHGPRILLVDGCQVFRLGMREVIKSAFTQASIIEVTTFTEACATLQGDPAVTLVVMDLHLSDCDGFIGLFQMRNEFPDIPVVLVCDRPDEASMDRAIQFGAAGFTSKSSPVSEFVKMLGEIAQGSKWVSPPVPFGDKGGEVGAIASLSPAQFRILVGLQKGLRNKQIAFEMGVTEKTVKAYTTTMYRKLGVNSRTQALLLARRAFSPRNSP